MKSNVPQITLRNLPEPVNRYLRKRAAQTGKSLNQTVIDELSRSAQKEREAQPTVLETLQWFIGSMDDETYEILQRNEREEKQWLRAQEAELRAKGEL